MKKTIYIIIAVIAVILIIFGLRAANNYYDQNYSGKTAYAKIFNQVPEKKAARDNHGKLIKGISEYDYQINFVDEDGKTQKIDYLLSGEDVKPFKTNTYVKATIGNSRIIKGPNYITKNDVPRKLINKIK